MTIEVKLLKITDHQKLKYKKYFWEQGNLRRVNFILTYLWETRKKLQFSLGEQASMHPPWEALRLSIKTLHHSGFIIL